MKFLNDLWQGTILEYAASLIAFLFSMPVSLLEKAGEKAAEILSSPTGSVDGVMKIIDGFVNGTIPLVQSFSYALALFFFLWTLLELCMSDRLTVETFIKQFTYFILGYGAVWLSPKLYTGLKDFGNAITSYVGAGVKIDPNLKGADGTFTDINNAVTKMFESSNFLTGGGAWIILVIMAILASVVPLLASLAMVIVMYIVAFTRAIEIAVRGVMLPIGFALMVEDGMKGPGMRFMKKFLAVCTQGLVFAIVGKLISGTVGTLYTDLFSKVEPNPASTITLIMPFLECEFVLAGFAIAAIMILFKSQQLISEAFGV